MQVAQERDLAACERDPGGDAGCPAKQSVAAADEDADGPGPLLAGQGRCARAAPAVRRTRPPALSTRTRLAAPLEARLARPPEEVGDGCVEARLCQKRRCDEDTLATSGAIREHPRNRAGLCGGMLKKKLA